MVNLHRSRPSHSSSHASRRSAGALQRTRVVAVAVVLALLASISAGPMANAQEAPPPPTGNEAAALIPEIFEPGAINRSPLASQLPAAGEELSTPGPAGVKEIGEVVERRTEDSATFLTEDGRFETVFYGGAVHYLDAQGAWQPIDNSLVPDEAANGSLRNAAGTVDVSLPAALGAEPVRVTKDDISVAFRLRGAQATPSPGTPASLPPSSEAVAKASATYANALPGVDIAYTATAKGVKEDLVLAGPGAASTFDFAVNTSAGLTAQETPSGGIDFVDGEGTTRASFVPPFAYDASFKATGAETAFTEDAVSLRIVETSPELVVRLAIEQAWLDAPERVWPVVIDPIVTIGGVSPDTYLNKSYPNNNYGTSQYAYLWSGDLARRPLYANNNIQNFFDEPVTLFSATLQLHTTSFVSTPVNPVGVYRVEATSWNSTQATWNHRLTGTPWKAPGGDFLPQPLFVHNDVTGATGWRSFPITSAAQAWVDGEPNLGVLLKYVDERSGDLAPFASSNHSDASIHPRVVVNWEALEGVRAPYSHEEFDLGSAGAASVNVASGNLTLARSDLGIAGTGLSATVGRSYQSRANYHGSVAARWRMWPQSEERLYNANAYVGAFASNGDVMWHGGPDELLVFSKKPDGSYASPHGYRASLVRTSDAGGSVFKLTDHVSGTARNFTTSGYLRDITDRNGNKLSFGYTCDTECYMVSMTDTQGRVTTFERAGQYKVTKMVDPAGRTHLYGYESTAEKTNLSTYTDPAGHVTRYAYTGSELGLLSRVDDPNGNATAFAYDSRDRVTALTRITDPTTGTGPTWRFDYSTPWQTTVTDPNGHATVHHFDRQGRVKKVVDALGHVRQASYDSNSNVKDRTSATGAKSIDTFHAVTSNLESSALPTGAKATFKHDHPTHTYSLTSYTNAQGNTWKVTYETAVANVKTVTDSMATAGITTFEYNPNGTVEWSTDAKGAKTTYGYDAEGNQTSVTPPAPLGATTIGYDGLSRVTSTTDGKGQTTTYAYDVMDRLRRIGFADGLVVTMGYDPGGRLDERIDATGTTTYVYDRLNRVAEEHLLDSRLNAYTYDATGNLKTMTDATGVVTYGYNAVNLVDTLVEPDGATTTFAYDDDDNRRLTTYPNGTSQEAKYDASGRLETIDGKRGTTLLTHFFYTYNVGVSDTLLRQTVTDKDNRTTTYGYDPLDRLKQAQTKAGTSVVADYAYDYDAVGNRISEIVNGTTTTAAFNDADQLTSRAGMTYSYDLNGNQTGSSAGQVLAYNAADQTTSLKRAGGTALASTYAGANQVERATAGATTFTNSMLGLSVATDAGAAAYTRDPSGGLVGMRGANRSYYLFDGLGSVVAVTEANGGVTNTYTYDPYGVTTETKAAGTNVSNPWRYAGQYQDVSTGLYKMGARYYQPELGRWTQRDPSGLDGNPYSYVGGDPANFADPTGTVRKDCGRITCSVYSSVAEARYVHEVLSNDEGQFMYDMAAVGVCWYLGGGVPCAAAYVVGGHAVRNVFADAAESGGCVKYTSGIGPNVGIEVVPASDEYCDYA